MNVRRVLKQQGSHSAILAQIAEIERDMGGEVCLAARNLQTGRMLSYRADRMVMTASIIKLPILIHVALCVREGTASWQEPVALTAQEKVGGSGVLKVLSDGLVLSVRDLCTLMMVVSDNTATNLIVERFGVEAINRRMRSLGLARTTINRKAFSREQPSLLSARYGFGVTTPLETLRLLTEIAEGRVGDSATSADLLYFLQEQQYRDGIPRFLPADWKYAGKTGAIDSVRNDAGIVTAPDGRRYALALFCQKLRDTLWTPENSGLVAIARLSRLLIDALHGA
ncbi:MAG: serine hydrolase [Chloroherpetonaceae bacterium]|nr:class A beta-lactamase-related serine hydrolase [Chthonomonadaceae bacterium]MDW8208255.1 serine hydrolase [Chloroherpetonaceae bacterium]